MIGRKSCSGLDVRDHGRAKPFREFDAGAPRSFAPSYPAGEDHHTGRSAEAVDNCLHRALLRF
jgi:hypothetical protein